MRNSHKKEGYKEFEAAMLYCPYCRQTVPVRKKLLLILPEGEKYDYCCAHCGKPIGEKIDPQKKIRLL